MNNKEYLEKALRSDGAPGFYEGLATKCLNEEMTLLRNGPRNLTLIHSVIGLAGEVGELTDTVKKHFLYGKDLDIENLKEECGDVLWYMALMLKEIGSSFDEVMEMNVNKLLKRYPGMFTQQDALERKDKQ